MAVKVLLLVVVAVLICMVSAKKSKGPDPKECEVCVANLEAIDGECIVMFQVLCNVECLPLS